MHFEVSEKKAEVFFFFKAFTQMSTVYSIVFILNYVSFTE